MRLAQTGWIRDHVRPADSIMGQAARASVYDQNQTDELYLCFGTGIEYLGDHSCSLLPLSIVSDMFRPVYVYRILRSRIIRAFKK